jgi:hypothetical protein
MKILCVLATNVFRINSILELNIHHEYSVKRTEKLLPAIKTNPSCIIQSTIVTQKVILV